MKLNITCPTHFDKCLSECYRAILEDGIEYHATLMHRIQILLNNWGGETLHIYSDFAAYSLGFAIDNRIAGGILYTVGQGWRVHP